MRDAAACSFPPNLNVDGALGGLARAKKRYPLCTRRVVNNIVTLKLGVRGDVHEGEDKMMRVPFFRPGREQLLKDELYV